MEKDEIFEIAERYVKGTGKSVFLTGKAGTGKTTIINLLMRFYDHQSGEILMDGIPSVNIKRKDLRLAFNMVLQSTDIVLETCLRFT